VGNFLSNTLEYKEKLMLFTQYGFKVNKFSYLFGLRWEDTNIDVNLLGTQEFNNKKYNKFSQVLLQLMKFQIKVVYP
jgi:hypothetical protein